MSIMEEKAKRKSKPRRSDLQRPYKVFHFENNANFAVAYGKAFSRRHFSYHHFQHPPKHFLRFIRDEEPDLIIMDTSMPKMDGFSAVQLLKQHKDTSSIPVLGLSDVDSWVGVRWANNLLIDDYWMHTEHTPEEVVEKVASMLTPKPQNEASREDSGALHRKKKRRRHLYYACSGLFALLIAVAFLYLYPGEIGRYEKKFPELTVDIISNTYTWNYRGEEYTLERNLYREIDDFYAQHPVKVFEGETSPTEYYSKFLGNLETDRDGTIVEVAGALSSMAGESGLTEDETVDFVASFVQSIPYDFEKRQSMLDARTESNAETQAVVDDIDASFFPRFPYETLYDRKGICTDKTFLTIVLLQKMGYGTALFDMDRHVAPGVQCPPEHSSFNSGFCYIETTVTGFVVGQVPTEVEQFGQAVQQNIQGVSASAIDISSDDLVVSNVRVFKVSGGKSYGGYGKREPIVAALRDLEETYSQEISSLNGIELEIANLETSIETSRLQVAAALETYHATQLFEDYDAYRDVQTQLELHEQEHALKVQERDEQLDRIEELIVQYQSLADFLEMN